MGAPSPTVRDISYLKTKIMQPALTSNFECHFVIPEEVKKQLNSNSIIVNSSTLETLTVSCSEASLPGSSLTTHDLNNDFTGVTQKHVYRRLYDDRADFTFYVNRDYLPIKLFEVWMRYCVGEQQSFGESNTISFRNNYAKNYKAKAIYIRKFEKDYGLKENANNNTLLYTFVNAFPISINSIPISYESSQLLKCTVSFSYDRYFVDNPRDVTPQGQPTQSSATGIPNTSDITYSGVKPSTNIFSNNVPITDYSNTFNNTSLNQYNISPGTATDTFTQTEINSFVNEERSIGNFSSTGEDPDETYARINFR